MVGNCSRALRNPGRYPGLGGQMHKKQHQRGFLFCSQLARGKRIQEAVEWSKDGVPETSLWRLHQKEERTPCTSHGTQLWTPSGGGGDGAGHH